MTPEIRTAVARVSLPVGLTALLLCLAAASVARRSWSEVEDGVFWAARPDGTVVAFEVARGSPAARAGVRPGDVLELLDGRPVDRPEDVTAALHRARPGAVLTYALVRPQAREVVQVDLEPLPAGNRPLYYVLAAVGVFTLLVGASVRLRRPADPATLHFFWLTVAFFGVLAVSFSGRLDRADWVFYWTDVVALLLVPPLLLHFALVFPDRPGAWVATPRGRRLWPWLYAPAAGLGAVRVAAFARGSASGSLFSTLLGVLERLEVVVLAVYVGAALVVMARALRRVRSVTARRQLRWIAWGTLVGASPFIVCYVVPFAVGLEPPRGAEYTAVLLGVVPLAFASAIVRYRLMDVEVIIKRGLGWAAAAAAIGAIYLALLRVSTAVLLEAPDQRNTVIALLATLVVVLLAAPVKRAVQTALDRLYYRDRYDYRRALVAFARELNSDLDLLRLAERLVTRISETLVVDRLALLLAPLVRDGAEDFAAVAAVGFAEGEPPLRLSPRSEVGARLIARHVVALDDPAAQRRLPADEVAAWREAGIHYFVPCVSKAGTIAVLALGRKAHGEPLSSEDMALLAAVAGQAATAVENARLYQELRAKAEELDRLREFSENIFESLTDGLLVVDETDTIVRWNLRLEALTRVSRADAVGQPLAALFEPEFVQALERLRREVPSGAQLYRVPLAFGTGEGRRQLLVNVATAPLRTASGGTAGTIVVIEDITARVQLEEQLQISEKMASIGLLAAGVAHEINTPLTGISSFTQMLLEQADPNDPKTKLLEKIERQTFRAAKIVNGLLNLARPSRVERGPVDLHAVINDVLALVEHQFRAARVQIRKVFAPRPPIVEGAEYKLQQVFLNLFLNARDAMPKGGWLSITTRVDGDVAEVEVADTGLGIPREHLSRIYDPFFTTKAGGQGTGLGLSITYGIVQEHCGTIACESQEGQGTRFRITFPLAASARPSEAAR